MDEWRHAVDGVEVHGLTGGSGTILLWLHGPHSQIDERGFLDRLAARYRVIAPEHPGFGTTERIGWLRSMEDMALFYRHLVREVASGERVVLAGHSLGGWIAAEYACRFPDTLDALLLVAPLGLRLADAPPADMFMLTAGELAEREWHDPSRRAVPADPSSLPYIRDSEMTAQLAWEPRLFSPRLTGRLNWIDVPTVVAWGAQDRLLPPAYADAWAGLIPAARAAIIPGAGHYAHLERPESCVNEFTRALTGASMGA